MRVRQIKKVQADKQTDKYTNMLIAILRTSIGNEIRTVENYMVFCSCIAGELATECRAHSLYTLFTHN